MLTRRLSLLALTAILLCSGNGWGQTVTILNPSFESPTLADGANQGVDAPLLINSSSGVVGNWTITMNTLVGVPIIVPARGQIENPTGAGPLGINGSQMGRITSAGLAGVATAGTFFQDLDVSFTSNTRYTMTALVGLQSIAVVPSTFGFSIMDGNTPVATTSQSALLILLTNSNQFFQATLTFDTNATPPSGDIGVQFFQTNLVGSAGSFIFDNVTLTAVAIPEPSTYALIAGSLLIGGYVLHRRRRRLTRESDALLHTRQ